MSFADRTTGATIENFARYVTAVFDDRGDAEAARRDLLDAGIAAGDITIADREAIKPPAAGAEPRSHPQGFWETLKELFMPDEDRYSFEEGLRRGGFTVAVRTDTASHDRVIDILDRDGAVDMDARETAWRSEGWTGYGSPDPVGQDELGYELPAAGTAGFGASQADHWPIRPDAAPSVESPGALPDAALSGALDPIPPHASQETAPKTAAPPIPPMTGIDSPPAAARRDDSHGRARVRVYAAEPPSGDRPVP